MYHFSKESYTALMDIIASWVKHEDAKGNRIYVPIDIIRITVKATPIRESNSVQYKEINMHIEVALRNSLSEISMLRDPAAHPMDKEFVATLKDWDFEVEQRDSIIYLKTWKFAHTDYALSGTDKVVKDYNAICDCVEEINKEHYPGVEIHVDRINASSKKGCYIATAVYGTYNCPQLWTLRRFRDDKLLHTWYGRLFVKFYYATSPIVIRIFGKTKWFNRFWRTRLDSITQKLQSKGYQKSPYKDR